MEVLKKPKIAFVCCYFNPCNYLSKYINFLLFYNRLCASDEYDLYVVESYNNTSNYRIASNVNKCTSVYCEDTYWQKETLLNIGINKIKNKYKYVGWLDADIHFVSNDWLRSIKTELKKFKIVQICSVINQHTNHASASHKTYSMSHYLKKSDNISDTLHNRLGEPGYGYVYHTSLFKTADTPLYDKAIVGSGDFLNLIGYLNISAYDSYINSDRFFADATEFRDDFERWRDTTTKVDMIGVSKNTIRVYYHGDKVSRKYITRETILRSHKYNPTKDLASAGEVYKLKNKNIKKSILRYFINRKEDDCLLNLVNTAEFKQKLLPIILKVDPSFNASENPLKYVSKLKKLKPPQKKKPIQYQNQNTTVGVKLYNPHFNICKVNNAQVIIDKTNEHMKYNHNTWYLQFILDNYKNLPRLCFFVNENLPNSFYKMANAYNEKIQDPLQCKYTPIENKLTDVKLSNNLHSYELNKDKFKPAQYGYLRWCSIYGIRHPLLKLHTKKCIKLRHNNNTLSYNSKNSFFVGASIIRKTPKKTYETLLKLVMEI